jgi:hypothetical protein
MAAQRCAFEWNRFEFNAQKVCGRIADILDFVLFEYAWIQTETACFTGGRSSA